MHHHAKLLSREDAAKSALMRCQKLLVGSADSDVNCIRSLRDMVDQVDFSKLADEMFGPAVPVLPSYATMATDMNSFYIEADAPE